MIRRIEHELINCKSVFELKQRRLRWAGHAARKGGEEERI
jgi:hypothetical protein